VVKGKFSYLSPEAANGIEVDRRADIFAVGIILYELLTSRRLFYGENDYQTVELVRHARVPSVAAQNPEVDEELEGVVRRALALNPQERYGHAMDLGDALAQYLFSRGKKVTSRDIAHLVAEVVQERGRQGTVAGPRRSVIDALINDEIVKFTSLDSPGASVEPTGAIGARPLSPDEIDGISSGTFPLNPRHFGKAQAADDNGEEPVPLTKPRAPRTSEPGGRAATPARGKEPRLSPPRGGKAPTDRSAVPQLVTDGLSGAVDSLEQLLEPPSRAVVVADEPPPLAVRGLVWFVLVALALALVAVGALVFVKVRALHHVPPVEAPRTSAEPLFSSKSC
jgi:serine/threonine-protein kinase